AFLRGTRDDLDEVALLDLAPHGLDHLRCKRNDLHELLIAKFTADRPEDTGAARLTVRLKNDSGVLVEADVRAVSPARRLLRTNDNRLHDVALLHVAARNCVLDGGDNGVAETRVPATRAPENTNREQLLGAAVIGHPE